MTSFSSVASKLYKNNFFLYLEFFLSVFINLLFISVAKTVAPLSKQVFVIARPIPDTPAEIIIFLFFNELFCILRLNEGLL